MSTIRLPLSAFRSLTRFFTHRNLRLPSASPRPTLPNPRLLSTTPSHFSPSTSGYGETGSDPISSHPQDQGPRPRSDTEHPGPEPVSEGQGKSGIKGKPVPREPHGTASGSGKSHGPESVTDENGNKRRGVATDAGGAGEGVRGSSGAKVAHPKILDERNPGPAGAGVEGEEGPVEKHNRELRERPHKEGESGEKEWVGKGYWKGEE